MNSSSMDACFSILWSLYILFELAFISDVTSWNVIGNNVIFISIGNDGSSHLGGTIPHHLGEVSSVIVESRLIEVVIGDLLVPQVCNVLCSWLSPHHVGNVLPHSIVVPVLQQPAVCYVLGPFLGFGCSRWGPFHGRTSMLASQFVVG